MGRSVEDRRSSDGLDEVQIGESFLTSDGLICLVICEYLARRLDLICESWKLYDLRWFRFWLECISYDRDWCSYECLRLEKKLYSERQRKQTNHPVPAFFNVNLNFAPIDWPTRSLQGCF